MPAKLRVWHWVALALAALLAVLLLWLALAYGGLPRLWSHHEHKRIGRREAITSFTAQDIPADPINLALIGSADRIGCALRNAGWTPADPISLASSARIVASVVLNRSYPEAPVSPLYVRDRVQDLAFEQDEGRSADRRHHVRFWQVGPNRWLGAATFDRGVGVSLFTLQVTHHIGPDPDRDRELAGDAITGSGGRLAGTMSARIEPGRWRRNGGGDRYRTDGLIHVFEVGANCRPGPAIGSAAR